MLDMVVLSVLDVVIPIFVGIVCLGGGFVLAKYYLDTKLKQANKTADDIIEKAKENAEKIKKEKISETKKEVSQIKHEADSEIRDRKRSVQELENKINQRETRLDNRKYARQKILCVCSFSVGFIDELQQCAVRHNSCRRQFIAYSSSCDLKFYTITFLLFVITS